MDPQDESQESEPAKTVKLPSQLRALNSHDLLGDSKEVMILHRGDIYRLRETRNGKLILSK